MRVVVIALALLVAAGLYSQTGTVTPTPTASAAISNADTTEAVAALSHAIRATLGARGTRGTVTGIKVVNLSSGRDIFSLNASQPLTPASTMKLFTSSTALGIFGPSYKVPTEILADSLSRDAVVGDLYIRGHGDPTFNANDLDSPSYPDGS